MIAGSSSVKKARNCAACPEPAAQGATPFQIGNTFFQHGNGGIGKSRINKPKGLQIEQRCRVVYVINT